MARSTDLAKDIARLALTSTAIDHAALLQEVMQFCWEQLQWRQGDRELIEFINALRADIEP